MSELKITWAMMGKNKEVLDRIDGVNAIIDEEEA